MEAAAGNSNIPKKVARACDMCQKRKVKCDWAARPCSNCAQRRVECTFTYVKKTKKAPQRSAQRIAELQRRLSQLEDSIKTRMISGSESQTSNQFNADRELEERGTRPPLNQERSNWQKASFHEANRLRADSVDNFLPNSTGTDLLDLIEPNGFENPSNEFEKSVPRPHSPNIVKSTVKSTQEEAFKRWNSDNVISPFQERPDTPLPPLSEAITLLQLYFDNFNQTLPLFHQESFMYRVREDYKRDQQSDLEWWGALNVVFSLAHRLRAMSSFENYSNQREDKMALAYLGNALRVVPELTLRNTDLLGVQAMLGMAIILQGTPNWRSASALIAVSIRLLYNLGLHRKDSSLQFTALEREQRNRMFWIAFFLDKDYSLQLNQPPMINEEDIGVDLPSECPEDGLGYILAEDKSSAINLFRLHIDLALIQSRIYSMLYSLKAEKLSDSERMYNVQVLDNMLYTWRRKIPVQLRPEFLHKHLSNYSMIHMVVLHLSHFNCLTLVYGVSFGNRAWPREALTFTELYSELTPSGLPQSLPIIEAAKSSIKLLNVAPQGDNACVWLLLRSHVSALVIVLANALQNPEIEMTPSDIQLVNSSIALLDHLARNTDSQEVEHIHTFCTEAWRRVKIALNWKDIHLKTTGNQESIATSLCRSVASPLETKAAEVPEESVLQYTRDPGDIFRIEDSGQESHNLGTIQGFQAGQTISDPQYLHWVDPEFSWDFDEVV